LLRLVVYEGLREEAGGRRGSPAGPALTTLTASLSDGPSRDIKGLPRQADRRAASKNPANSALVYTVYELIQCRITLESTDWRIAPARAIVDENLE